MAITITNPTGLHDPTRFGYSHVAAVPAGSELVFVAGQYGSDASGQTTSPDFGAQVARSFVNLGTALQAAGVGYGDVVQIRTYIVDHSPEKLDMLLAAVRGIWGDRPPTQTLVGVAALALSDMLFEVEAVAVRR